MIGYLTGKVKRVYDSSMIVEVNGVGYEVFTSATTNEGEEIELYIFTNVREQEISLWGFREERDLDLFKLLISVGGIGTRSAMNLIQAKGFDHIVKAIVNGESKELKVSGIGPKLTQKIVIELRDKIKNIAMLARFSDERDGGKNMTIKTKEVDEAIEAVVSLGYTRNHVERVAREIIEEEGSSSDSSEFVKSILKNI